MVRHTGTLDVADELSAARAQLHEYGQCVVSVVAGPRNQFYRTTPEQKRRGIFCDQNPGKNLSPIHQSQIKAEKCAQAVDMTH